jgi:hypothetical protein
MRTRKQPREEEEKYQKVVQVEVINRVGLCFMGLGHFEKGTTREPKAKEG